MGDQQLLIQRGNQKQPLPRWWLLLIVVVTACISQPSDAGSESPASFVPSQPTSGASAQPSSEASGGGLERLAGLERLVLERNGVDTVELQLGEERLVERCMAEQGFTYPVASREAIAAGEVGRTEELLFDRRVQLGFAPGEDVSQGYGLLARTQRLQSEDDQIRPQQEAFLELDEATREQYGLALAGMPDSVLSVTALDGVTVSINRDGCRAQALETLYGDLETYLRASFTEGNLQSSVLAAVRSDAAFLEGQGLWSQCMSDRGFSVEPREEAVSRIAGSYNELDTSSEIQPLEEELSLAVADSECGLETGSMSTAFELYVAALESAADREEGTFLGLRELRLAALERLDDILSRG